MDGQRAIFDAGRDVVPHASVQILLLLLKDEMRYLSLSLYFSPRHENGILFQFKIQNPARERESERAREGHGAIHLPAAAPSRLLHDVGNQNEGQGSRVGTNNKHHTYANGNK